MTAELTALRDHCRRQADPRTMRPVQTDDERALWRLLADEIDTYLTPPPAAETPSLFEGIQ